MKVISKELKKIEIKQLFEEFNDQILKEGIDPKYSYMVYKNAEVLMPLWEAINKEIYNENADPEFKAFKDAQSQIIAKYADRDEQGNIVYNGKQPKITEQVVEFQKAYDELMEANKALFDGMNEKHANNNKIYLETVNVSVVVLDIDEFPPKTPPFVVGLLCA